jgi:hypothetical protein
MLTELRCPCGHRQETTPPIPTRHRCQRCGQTILFESQARGYDEPCWLLVGGEEGPARLAVPIPIATPLIIGGASEAWLPLPANGVDGAHVEVSLQRGARLGVRHIGDPGSATWINRARVASGVMGEADTLRVGPFRLRVTPQSRLLLAGMAAEPEVIVDDEAPARGAQAGDEDEGDLILSTPGGPRSTREKLRIAVCAAIIVAAGGYLARTLVWPPSPPDMPADTEFQCNVDGTRFRAAWEGGPPKCPQCGQLCLGGVNYQPEKLHPPPATSAPTAGDATARSPTAPSGGPKGGSP